MVAHFSDSWRDPAGERLPGAPVGYVLPAGEPLARYEIAFADGATRVVDVRRRFEIADGIIGWGYLPFAAIGHRDEETIDWRGPHARLTPGRYAPAGHGGALTIMPGSWGAAQTGIVDYVPSFDDDATYWLHAIPLGSDAEPVERPARPAGRWPPGHRRRGRGPDPVPRARPIRSSSHRAARSSSRAPGPACRTWTSASRSSPGRSPTRPRRGTPAA